METVEMDLMQAQIGSLATDVSRLEAKVADSTKSKTIVLTNEDIKDVTPISATQFGFNLVDSDMKDKIFSDAAYTGDMYIMLDMRALGGSQVRKAYYSTTDYTGDEPTIIGFDTNAQIDEDGSGVSSFHIGIYKSDPSYDGYIWMLSMSA